MVYVAYVVYFGVYVVCVVYVAYAVYEPSYGGGAVQSPGVPNITNTIYIITRNLITSNTSVHAKTD